jgi:hypothetical protein
MADRERHQVCNGMLVACTTMLLESCNSVGRPSDVASFVDHANKPTMMRRFVFDARTIGSSTSSVSLYGGSAGTVAGK